MDNYKLSECVVVNIENIARMTPQIKEQLMYKVALFQAKELAAQLNPDKLTLAKSAEEIAAAKEAVIEAANVWRIHHVCCPTDCPDTSKAQIRLGDSLDALDRLAPPLAPPGEIKWIA